MMGRNDEYQKRRGPVACETSMKCPKGHWENEFIPSSGDEQALYLFEASQASGGAFLSENERSDAILARLFAMLSLMHREIAQVQHQELKHIALLRRE